MSTNIIDARGYNPRLVPALAGTLPTDTASDRPVEGRVGWLVVLAFFGLFLGFAAFVRLDAAAYADGAIKVSGSRQAVQHRDGGIVSALYVREGQHVKAGDVLIELVGSEVAANERALAAQVIGLQAERARILAERSGRSDFTAPVEFAALTGEDRTLAEDAMRIQRSEIHARRSAVAAQKKVLGQQAAQLNQRIEGLGRQIQANDRQSVLYTDELAGMKDLQAQGYASANRVRALERSQAAVGGETANLSATAASTREQVGETRMQALTLDSQVLQQLSEQLRDTDAKLGDALPKWQAYRKQLEDTRIRATASGQVVGLDVFTVGGVIAPGQKLMEIVPDARPLVVDVIVNPNDADDLYVGQTAEVRFPSLHERDLPVFEGKISRMSADSFTDDKTGMRFYTAEVTVPARDLDEIRKLRGSNNGLKPGLPAQVLVPLRKRTLLQYLLEPLNQALWRSGREH